MPPLIVFAIAGIGVYAGYRMVRAALEQLDSDASDGASADLRQPRDLGVLEWDPTSGVYRPRK